MEDSVDKTLKIVIALVIIMIILSATNKVFFENKVKIPEDKVNPEEILLVDDYNRFYTVSSCVSKYLNYLTTNNTEKLLVLLSNEYKTKNNINETNIYTYIPKITGNKTFSPKKMYQQRLNQTIYKYYVYGTVEKDSLNTSPSKEDYYIIVILDESTMTFAIEPYDGSMFK
jgi:hypothetical protein